MLLDENYLLFNPLNTENNFKIENFKMLGKPKFLKFGRKEIEKQDAENKRNRFNTQINAIKNDINKNIAKFLQYDSNFKKCIMLYALKFANKNKYISYYLNNNDIENAKKIQEIYMDKDNNFKNYFIYNICNNYINLNDIKKKITGINIYSIYIIQKIKINNIDFELHINYYYNNDKENIYFYICRKNNNMMNIFLKKITNNYYFISYNSYNCLFNIDDDNKSFYDKEILKDTNKINFIKNNENKKLIETITQKIINFDNNSNDNILAFINIPIEYDISIKDNDFIKKINNSLIEIQNYDPMNSGDNKNFFLNDIINDDIFEIPTFQKILNYAKKHKGITGTGISLIIFAILAIIYKYFPEDSLPPEVKKHFDGKDITPNDSVAATAQKLHDNEGPLPSSKDIEQIVKNTSNDIKIHAGINASKDITSQDQPAKDTTSGDKAPAPTPQSSGDKAPAPQNQTTSQDQPAPQPAPQDQPAPIDWNKYILYAICIILGAAGIYCFIKKGIPYIKGFRYRHTFKGLQFDDSGKLLQINGNILAAIPYIQINLNNKTISQNNINVTGELFKHLENIYSEESNSNFYEAIKMTSSNIVFFLTKYGNYQLLGFIKNKNNGLIFFLDEKIKNNIYTTFNEQQPQNNVILPQQIISMIVLSLKLTIITKGIEKLEDQESLIAINNNQETKNTFSELIDNITNNKTFENLCQVANKKDGTYPIFVNIRDYIKINDSNHYPFNFNGIREYYSFENGKYGIIVDNANEIELKYKQIVPTNPPKIPSPPIQNFVDNNPVKDEISPLKFYGGVAGIGSAALFLSSDIYKNYIQEFINLHPTIGPILSPILNNPKLSAAMLTILFTKYKWIYNKLMQFISGKQKEDNNE